MSVLIKKIPPADLYAIRHEVLRPNQSIEDCKYPGDFDEQSFHLGAFDSELIGIASFYLESNSEFTDSKQYRLRGMATLPTHRGRGIASKLLNHAIEDLKAQGIDLLWCNARVSAEGFYKKLGFQKIGNQFEIELIGPHYVYFKKLS